MSTKIEPQRDAELNEEPIRSPKYVRGLKARSGLINRFNRPWLLCGCNASLHRCRTAKRIPRLKILLDRLLRFFGQCTEGFGAIPKLFTYHYASKHFESLATSKPLEMRESACIRLGIGLVACPGLRRIGVDKKKEIFVASTNLQKTSFQKCARDALEVVVG